jgi:hypothetical protein
MIYLYDRMRHLICLPYSVDGLHAMAANLGIGRHWFHAGKYPHYDIPKRDVDRIQGLATRITPKELLSIIQGVEIPSQFHYLYGETPDGEPYAEPD